MADRPNIVWLTIESTRADHTTMGGYERDTTPNLARIADDSDGRSFSGCFSHGIWTLSSSASILTGTAPSTHQAGMSADAIPDEIQTVPERLQDAGYQTACFSPNAHLSSATGLDRGFDEFAWISKSTLLESVGWKSILEYVANINTHGGGFTTDTRKHNVDYMTTQTIKRWLNDAVDDDPFFLYAHLGGPHHPYHPPGPYFDRFVDDAPLSQSAASDLSFHHHENFHELMAADCNLSSDEWETLLALYDGEIAHVDALVGRLFDHVRELDEDTIFVVTADHGELFGEDGLLAHIVTVNDAVSHVPLVVHGFDDILEYDSELIQHADVVRGLLEHVGADADGVHGVSPQRETREFCVTQRGGKRARKNLDQIRTFNPEFDVSAYHEQTLHSVRTPEYRYRRSEDKTALFRLPDETRDMSTEEPSTAADLEAKLDDWLQTDGRSDGTVGEGKFTDGMKKQLADLGYLVD